MDINQTFVVITLWQRYNYQTIMFYRQIKSNEGVICLLFLTIINNNLQRNGITANPAYPFVDISLPAVSNPNDFYELVIVKSFLLLTGEHRKHHKYICWNFTVLLIKYFYCFFFFHFSSQQPYEGSIKLPIYRWPTTVTHISM